MPKTRFLTAFLGLVVVSGQISVMNPAAAAAPAEGVAAAALPTCTSWSTHFAAYTTDHVVHVPTLGRNTFNKRCSLRQGDNNDAVKVMFPVWTYLGNVMTKGCDHSPF